MGSNSIAFLIYLSDLVLLRISSESELNDRLMNLFPDDLEAHVWNRKVVQMGMSDMALEKLEEIKTDLGANTRQDLRSFADVIDFDEGKIE